MSGLTTSHGTSGHGAAGSHHDLFSNDNRQKTYDHHNKDPFIYYVTDGDNHWNLVTNNRRSPGQPALVDAQYYANVTDDYLFLQHGLKWIDPFPGGCGYSAMQSVAHYNRNYNNAFWNGTYTVYGDGDGNIFRELSGALDVVAHEHMHGVTECTSNLIYQEESGALNESSSDIFGNSAEFYAAANGLDPSVSADWFIGEDVYTPNNPNDDGFRDMADPEKHGDPDHYSEFQVGGNVHTNSGIPNHAYYLLVNGGLNASCDDPVVPHNSAHCTGSETPVTAITLADAEGIFFLGFSALSSGAIMADARAATETAASSLFGTASQQLQSTTDAWLAVGVGAAPGCTIPDDCNDGNACTTDSCNAGVCSNIPMDCDAGSLCTTDSCNAGTGLCSYVAIDCDDGDECTADSCDAGGCSNDVVVFCDDTLFCTTDSCNPATGECVISDNLCSDGNSCTIDSCDEGNNDCVNTNSCVGGLKGDTCTVDADCLSGKCKGQSGNKICK